MLANEALVELAHWRALPIPCRTEVGQQHHTRSSQQVELLEQHLLRDAAESAQERLTQSQEGAVVEGTRLQIREAVAQPGHRIVDNRQPEVCKRKLRLIRVFSDIGTQGTVWVGSQRVLQRLQFIPPGFRYVGHFRLCSPCQDATQGVCVQA